jgi:hypothetical protein
MQQMAEIPEDVPGSDLVGDGIADLAAGRVSECDLLVAMAAPRLRALGIDVPASCDASPSRRLYDLLSETGPGAYGR